MRPKRFLPDRWEDPKGNSIAYFWAEQIERGLKAGQRPRNSWVNLSPWLNAGRDRDARHLRGQVVYASPEELTNRVAAERGKSEPVHIASEGEDSVADLKQGLSCVREQRKGRGLLSQPA